uniref:Uncharacterized protein n=1 Tax=Ectopseudomonas oleovorans TaxID=301 RepID=A0A653B3W5_ECTOL
MGVYEETSYYSCVADLDLLRLPSLFLTAALLIFYHDHANLYGYGCHVGYALFDSGL